MRAHPPSLHALTFRDAVHAALREDLGLAGDVTGDATIPPDARATAVLNARERGVLCGLPVAVEAFGAFDGITVTPRAADGDALEPGRDVATIDGPARAVLAAERVALNYLCHLSGIATLTRAYADAIVRTDARVVCTRKTVPGLRALAKYAVRCGGGGNHRFGLDDAILVKDNHIAVAGGVREAVRAARAFAGHLTKIEVEVDDLDQLREALDAGPDVVMLDNFTLEDLGRGVEMVGGRVPIEASGNVNLETIRAIAETGVDMISTSKLTMSAPSLDLGLDIRVT